LYYILDLLAIFCRK